MPQTDPLVDEYIAKAAHFAQPILAHLRTLVHTACPNVVESIKWSFPNFSYKGSILCNMAAFKQHATFGFWLASLMNDPHKLLAAPGERQAMGNLGKITSLNDLPADNILLQYIHEAMRLADAGAKLPRKQPQTTAPVSIPAYLEQALQQNNTALQYFNSLSQSHQREYIEWLQEAKTEATRQKRLATTLQWLGEGKHRNWKYQKC